MWPSLPLILETSKSQCPQNHEAMSIGPLLGEKAWTRSLLGGRGAEEISHRDLNQLKISTQSSTHIETPNVGPPLGEEADVIGHTQSLLVVQQALYRPHPGANHQERRLTTLRCLPGEEAVRNPHILWTVFSPSSRGESPDFPWWRQMWCLPLW